MLRPRRAAVWVATSLLAALLPVGHLIGAPSAPRDARCVGVEVPEWVGPGQRFSAVIRMENTGQEEWRPSERPYRLGAQTPWDNLNWGTARVELPVGSVKTGEVARFTHEFTAPARPGSWAFDWRMVQERVAWFGQMCSASIVVSAGPPPPPPPPPGPVDQTRPVAIFDGRADYLAVWQEGSAYHGAAGYDLAIGRISAASPGAISKVGMLSTAPDSQESPELAMGDGLILAVWQDLRNGRDYDVYAARLRPDGTVLDPQGILVAGGLHNQMLPTAAWDGKAFVVMFSDFRDGKRYVVRGASVHVDGRVVPWASDPVVSREASHALRPRLERGGDGLWLFWAEARGPNESWGMSLTTGQQFRLSRPGYKVTNFASASDGRHVIVAWPLKQEKAYDGVDIVGLLWDTQGRRLVTVDPGKTTLWWMTGSGPQPATLWVKDGTNKTPTHAHRPTRAFSAAFDGKQFWVVWEDFENAGQGTPRTVRNYLGRRRVDPSTGAFPAGVRFEETSSPTPMRNPYVVSNGTTQTLLVYDHEHPSGERVVRVMELQR